MTWFWQRPYCSRCGSKKIRVEYSHGFDSRTGKPVVRSYTKCPNSRSAYASESECWPRFEFPRE